MARLPVTYREARNAEFVLHGDLFPSHLAQLEEPETFNYRELLVGHKYKTDLEELLIEGRARGICSHRSIITGDVRDAAMELLRIYMDVYSPLQAPESHAGQMKTLGFYMRQGGSCRHRSAGLQLVLQEAGIESRYVRGVLMGSGAHAWVEVRYGCTAEYGLILDPNFGAYGCRTDPRPIQGGDDPELVVFGLEKGATLSDTDPDDLVYMMNPCHFNTIWRPLRRQFELHHPASHGDTIYSQGE